MAQSDYNVRQAESHQRDAASYIRQAQGYDRDVECFTREVAGHLRDAEYYHRMKQYDRARNSWNAVDRASDCQRKAANARDYAKSYIRRAKDALSPY